MSMTGRDRDLLIEAYTVTQVRVPLAGLRELQATDQDVCAGIYRAPYELGAGQH